MKFYLVSLLFVLGIILAACGSPPPENTAGTPTEETSTLGETQGTGDSVETAAPTDKPTESPTQEVEVPEVIQETGEATETSEPTPEPAETSTPLIGPAPRTHGTMHYNPILERVILTSGTSCANTWDFNDMDLNDVWAFNVEDESWESLGELNVPNPFNIGYDAESERVIYLTYGPIETWAFDPTSGEAQNMEPEEMPPDTIISLYLFGAPLAYDSESDRLILFGGGERPGLNHGETWAYDYNTNTWEHMQPENGPPERAFHSMVYDTESDRVILWGGLQNGGTDTMIWAYDYNTNTWESFENINGPEEHYERFGMVYHQPSDRIFLYSGFREGIGSDEEFIFDPATWSYDYNTNTWEEIVTETNPGKRTMYSMAYDENTDKVILFSGEQTSKYANDLTTAVWMFDPVTLEWTDVSKELVGCP